MFEKIRNLLARTGKQLQLFPGGEARAAAGPGLSPEEVQVARALTQSLSGERSAIRQVREILARVSQSEAQRNGYYCGMLNRVARDRIGTGPKLRPMFENEKWNKQLSSLWGDWVKCSKFAQKLRMAVRDSSMRGATVGTKYTNTRSRCRVKLDIRFVDSLRLRHPYQFGSYDKRHADGIDFDEHGNPVQYWIDETDVLRDDHFALVEPPKRYDAEHVIHYFTKQTSEQVHGIPEASAGLLLYPDLRRYVKAVIRNAEMSANYVFTLENANAPAQQYASDPFACIPVEPGMIQELPNGYSLNAVVPSQPSAQHRELINSLVNECSRCFDMPLIMALGTAGDSNFSSANFDVLAYEYSTRLHRQDIETDIVDNVFFDWYDEAILIEDYLPPVMRRNYPTAEHIPHAWGWDRIRRHADPAKESAAIETSLKTGEKTLALVYEDNGQDARSALEAEAQLFGVSYEEYMEMLLAARFKSPSPQEQEMAEKASQQQQQEPEMSGVAE